MADFVAVLKKTIDGLAENTPELRQKVYAKARDTVAAKLAAIQPPPPQIAVDRQKKALEDAIEAVETSYGVADEAIDDFDSVLADLERQAPPPPAARASAVPAPPAPAVAPAASAPAPSLPRADAPAPERPVPSARPGRLDTPPELAAADDGGALVAVEPAAKPVPDLARGAAAAPSGTAASRPAAPRAPRAGNRRLAGMLAAAAIAVAVVGAAGYGVWLNRDAFADLFGSGGAVVAGGPTAAEPAAPEGPAATEAATAAPSEPEEEEREIEIAAVQPAAPVPPAQAARTEPAVEKFTQRLLPDGTETDPGPAGGERRVGEGTSLAAVTDPGSPVASDASPASAGAAPAVSLPVGQRAIFYEERTTLADGTADEGAIVWSLVQESPGGDQPPEPAVRGEVSIPSRDLSIRMTIRRNADASLPASHIVEMIFITSGSFEGGGVENVLRIAFKQSEAAPGAPLIGIPAKIADGYFLVALSDNDAERNQNTQLMLRENWIDIPISYRSGRRALVTMEKGLPGAKVFEDAVRAWQGRSSG